MRGTKAKYFRALSRKVARIGTEYELLIPQTINAMAAPGVPIPGKHCLFLGVTKLTERCARFYYKKLKRGKLMDHMMAGWNTGKAAPAMTRSILSQTIRGIQ